VELPALALVLVVGVAAGFLNTVAGGGSALTMPMLIFLGLPSSVANGTARVAIMLQNLTAVAGFRSKGHFEPALGLQLGLPALAGALVGSRIAVDVPDAVFNAVLAGVMVLVLVSIFFKPKPADGQGSAEPPTGSRRILLMAIFFAIGVYGGFIQAGVGFLIMSSLIFLSGYDLVRVNAVKVVVILVYTVAALTVFLLNGKVEWGPGLTLAVGNSAGAWLGARFSVAGGERWIRAILVVAVLVMAVRVSGVLGLIGIL
jgi:uncharacterized membrane protein YfcA